MKVVMTIAALAFISLGGLIHSGHAQDAQGGSSAEVSRTEPAPDAERMAAAREMMDVLGIIKQMEGAMESVKRGFLKGLEKAPEDAKAGFEKNFDDSMERMMSYREEMMADFAALYSKHFTADEMKDVTKFYRSGTGAKFVSMMPQLMREGSVIGMKYSNKMLQELKKTAPAQDKEEDE